MIIARLMEIEIPNGVKHIATSWDIASDPLFNNIVCSSSEDKINKTAITFNETVDPNIKYYGRARMILSTGPTLWGNIDIFVPKTVDEVDTDAAQPSAVSIPVIGTETPSNNHNITGFKLFATGFDTTSDASHLDTSWIIEDENGKIVWKSIRDHYNLTSITVTNIILKPNSLYRIRCMFFTNTGDCSQMATKTIVTSKNDDIKLITNLFNFDISITNNLLVNLKHDVKELIWEIFNIENNFLNKILINKTNKKENYKLVIPANTLKNNKSYLLKIRTDENLDDTFIVFTTI